jgi:hypothetical protein
VAEGNTGLLVKTSFEPWFFIFGIIIKLLRIDEFVEAIIFPFLVWNGNSIAGDLKGDLSPNLLKF